MLLVLAGICYILRLYVHIILVCDYFVHICGRNALLFELYWEGFWFRALLVVVYMRAILTNRLSNTLIWQNVISTESEMDAVDTVVIQTQGP